MRGAFLLHRQGEDAPPARVMVFAQSEEQARRSLAASSNSHLARLASCTHVAAAHVCLQQLLNLVLWSCRTTAFSLLSGGGAGGAPAQCAVGRAQDLGAAARRPGTHPGKNGGTLHCFLLMRGLYYHAVIGLLCWTHAGAPRCGRRCSVKTGPNQM